MLDGFADVMDEREDDENDDGDYVVADSVD